MVRAEPTPPSNKMFSVETTLSLARKPVMRLVAMRQSPRPRGESRGASHPATKARMLSRESSTRLKVGSKLFKNQITMVATRITEKARWRKSLAFSHSSCSTLRGLGRR